MTEFERFTITVMGPDALTPAHLARWATLRASNSQLWSPFFDHRYVCLAAQFAPKPKVAVVSQGEEIVGFFPFQGDVHGLIRPLGAPLCDQHGVVAVPNGPTINDIMALLPQSTLRFTGLVGDVDQARVRETHEVYLADMAEGVDAYQAARTKAWPDHFKKVARRHRKAERDFGSVRIDSGIKDSALLDTLIAWKRQKYRATGRHDILGVPWIVGFVRALLASETPDFSGEIAALWLGDELAAIEFGMRSGPVLHSWFPSYDPKFSSVSPGVMLMDGMILQAPSRGITLVDLGAGHSEYKKHVSNRCVDTVDGRIEGTGLRRLLTAPVEGLGQWVEQAGFGGVSALPGKLGRRLEMILAAEPTIGGRLRGLVWAAQDMVQKPS
jgi:CelD/BcsL family acetyltransferase involved in cellulose biosynthesis